MNNRPPISLGSPRETRISSASANPSPEKDALASPVPGLSSRIPSTVLPWSLSDSPPAFPPAQSGEESKTTRKKRRSSERASSPKAADASGKDKTARSPRTKKADRADKSPKADKADASPVGNELPIEKRRAMTKQRSLELVAELHNAMKQGRSPQLWKAWLDANLSKSEATYVFDRRKLIRDVAAGWPLGKEVSKSELHEVFKQGRHRERSDTERRLLVLGAIALMTPCSSLVSFDASKTLKRLLKNAHGKSLEEFVESFLSVRGDPFKRDEGPSMYRFGSDMAMVSESLGSLLHGLRFGEFKGTGRDGDYARVLKALDPEAAAAEEAKGEGGKKSVRKRDSARTFEGRSSDVKASTPTVKADRTRRAPKIRSRYASQPQGSEALGFVTTLDRLRKAGVKDVFGFSDRVGGMGLGIEKVLDDAEANECSVEQYLARLEAPATSPRGVSTSAQRKRLGDENHGPAANATVPPRRAESRGPSTATLDGGPTRSNVDRSTAMPRAATASVSQTMSPRSAFSAANPENEATVLRLLLANVDESFENRASEAFDVYIYEFLLDNAYKIAHDGRSWNEVLQELDSNGRELLKGAVEVCKSEGFPKDDAIAGALRSFVRGFNRRLKVHDEESRAAELAESGS